MQDCGAVGDDLEFPTQGSSPMQEAIPTAPDAFRFPNLHISQRGNFSRGNEIWIACNLDCAKELQTYQLDKITAEVQRHTQSEKLFAKLAPIPLIFTMGVTLFGQYNDSELFASVDDRNGYDDSSPKQPADVPVLIVGGGPAGLLQAYLLSRLGVRSLVVERYPERLGAPKAHALSPRSLEICRQFGLDMGHIRSLGTPRDDARWVNFQTTLSGIPLGRLPYERMDPEVLDSTPEMIHNIPQPDFEQYLSEELSKQSVAEIWKGISFVSLEEHGDTVTTLLEEKDTGKLYKVRSKFVIACDGAKSKVREVIGTKTDGEDSYETMMTIHFQANLREIVGDRVGMLHWLFDPLVSGFIIAYDLDGIAVLITNFDSNKYPIEKWDCEVCLQFVEAAIGTDISPKILSHRPWILSRRVAEDYRKGNVFLAGDAAHSFPPTGGLGLNSGLADVHNLAFKVAAVLNGVARGTFLDTYNEDRRHVAEVNSRQSVKNGQKIFGLLKALGTAGVDDVTQARQNMMAAIKDEEQSKAIEDGVEDQREHFDNLNLHIGYIYGDKSIPAHASHFTPTFTAGSRLPHAWLVGPLPKSLPQPRVTDLSYVKELEKDEILKKKYSTLDLCTYDAWTLLSPENSNDLPDITSKKPSLKINVFSLGDDFKLLDSNSDEDWLRDSGLYDGRAILVRPDQHIFGTFKTDLEAERLIVELDEFLGC